MSLYSEWVIVKSQEAKIVAHRRELEKQIRAELGFNENHEGAERYETEYYKITITGRINRKVDADKIQTIADEHGLTSHLGQIFRWKPEINMKEWKSADPSITAPFLDAITSTPGVPSIKIEPKEDK